MMKGYNLSNKAESLMHFDYTIYNRFYTNIRNSGGIGWGGNERICRGPAHITELMASGWLPGHGKALEVGCGEGNLCRLLEARGFSVTGMDVSRVAIEWALEKTPAGSTIEYRCGDFTQADILAGQRFDLILDGSCLHCIGGSGRTSFLHNVRRLLGNSGVFVLCSLCSKDDSTRELFRENLGFRHVASESDLLGELAGAGFDLLERRRRPRHHQPEDNLLLFARPSAQHPVHQCWDQPDTEEQE